MFCAIGTAIGAGVGVAVLAVPRGATTVGWSDRLGTLKDVSLVDTDVLWWLLPIFGAAIGAALSWVLARQGWSLAGRGVVDRRNRGRWLSAVTIIVVVGLSVAGSERGTFPACGALYEPPVDASGQIIRGAASDFYLMPTLGAEMGGADYVDSSLADCLWTHPLGSSLRFER